MALRGIGFGWNEATAHSAVHREAEKVQGAKISPCTLPLSYLAKDQLRHDYPILSWSSNQKKEEEEKETKRKKGGEEGGARKRDLGSWKSKHF